MFISDRLFHVRAELEDAKAEFDDAFKAKSFDPVRAEKAQKWLEAAKAALVSAVAGEQGELSRERALQKLERRLLVAQRVLRAVEFNLRRALKDVSGIPENTLFEDLAWRLESARTYVEGDLKKGGLKPSNRERLQRSQAYIAEAMYRADEVMQVRDQVEAIKADIAALKSQKGGAAA